MTYVRFLNTEKLQADAQDRTTLVQLDKELRRLSAKDMRHAALQVSLR